MKSVRGIYYDLNESDYKFNFFDLDFYFSSELYLIKFNNKFINYLKDEKNKLNIKYNCYINADYLFAISLYKQIEKRGFRVLYKNKKLNLKPSFELIILEA